MPPWNAGYRHARLQTNHQRYIRSRDYSVHICIYSIRYIYIFIMLCDYIIHDYIYIYIHGFLSYLHILFIVSISALPPTSTSRCRRGSAFTSLKSTQVMNSWPLEQPRTTGAPPFCDVGKRWWLDILMGFFHGRLTNDYWDINGMLVGILSEY